MRSSDESPSRWSPQKVIVVAALWLLGALLLGESALSAHSAYSDRRDADATTVGHWVDVDGNCGRYIAYRVEGREHRLDTATGRHHCSDVSEGEAIDVHYDPDRPSTAFRGSADPRPFLALTLAATASTVALVLVPPIMLLRRRRAAH